MFNEWPLAIARELSRRTPTAEFMGLTVGKERIYRKVSNHLNPPIRPLYNLSELERKWLSTAVSTEKVREYETVFGNDNLCRLVACSRQLGYGWVSGAIMAQTPLMRFSRDTNAVRRYVVGLLEFLFRLFVEARPDLVFCYVVAEAPAYALSKVCEHFGVPFRRLYHVGMGAKCILDDTPEGTLGPVYRTYRTALQNPTELEAFLPQAREHLKTFRSMPEQPEYQRVFFNRDENRKRSVVAIPGQMGKVLLAGIKVLRGPTKTWHEPSDWERRSSQLGITLRSLKLAFKTPYRSVGEFPDQPFAYYPLHVDPEETTLVRAPFLTNQLAVIEALSKSLPLSMDLVVKEHIGMIGRRPPAFIDQVCRMPKLFLASPLENTFELIRRAQLVCTITGTAAWEAMMLKKPVLVFGEKFPFLRVGQGVEYHSDFATLAGAISRALERPPIEDGALELFIASIFYHSFDFPAGLLWGRVNTELIEKNRTILKNICDKLEIAAREPVEGEQSNAAGAL